jgi:hypothetical protein
MNELLAKLVDVTYELFGVLIPGLIASAFLLVWLVEAQPLLTGVSGARYCLDLQHVVTWLNTSEKDGLLSFLALLVVWYLFGQVLLTVSRHPTPDAQSQRSGGRRLFRALTFRIPRSPDNYNRALKPLYDAVAEKFNPPGLQLEWTQFYPVVKSYLAEHLSKSLVALYQNKYTLHRSITMAGVILFWLSALTCVGAGIGCFYGLSANWGLLIGTLVLSLAITWSFSASFMLHWQMFGNSVVTEAYSLLNGPKK